MSEFEKKIAEYKNKINSCLKVGELDSLKLEVLGKNGLINLEFKKLSDLSIEEKKSTGKQDLKISKIIQSIELFQSVSTLEFVVDVNGRT